MYLCKFDEAGRRIATVLKGVHFKKDKEKQKYLDDGYIETSDEDYAFYVGNRGKGANGTGYVRGADGKPTDAPVKVPTKSEKLAQLEAEYEQESAELEKYYNKANIRNNTDLMDELREEIADLEAEYESKRKEIEEVE